MQTYTVQAINATKYILFRFPFLNLVYSFQSKQLIQQEAYPWLERNRSTRTALDRLANSFLGNATVIITMIKALFGSIEH